MAIADQKKAKVSARRGDWWLFVEPGDQYFKFHVFCALCTREKIETQKVAVRFYF